MKAIGNLVCCVVIFVLCVSAGVAFGSVEHLPPQATTVVFSHDGEMFEGDLTTPANFKWDFDARKDPFDYYIKLNVQASEGVNFFSLTGQRELFKYFRISAGLAGEALSGDSPETPSSKTYLQIGLQGSYIPKGSALSFYGELTVLQGVTDSAETCVDAFAQGVYRFEYVFVGGAVDYNNRLYDNPFAGVVVGTTFFFADHFSIHVRTDGEDNDQIMGVLGWKF